MPVGRFAPSPTGPAHPGTLLSALLAWLDARSTGSHFVLRIEDLDRTRCRPEFTERMIQDLRWLGIDWDSEVVQSDRGVAHADAMDSLEAAGRLYPCDCSRAKIRRSARRATDGGYVYTGHCRPRDMAPGGWRKCESSIRVRLDDTAFDAAELFVDSAFGAHPELRVRLPAREMGDPVVRRRDGAMAYNLAVVVDDDGDKVDRVVRGHDIAPSTSSQLALYELLGKPPPRYWHHFLLLEPRDSGQAKFAKLHGSVDAAEVQQHYSAAELCGFFAKLACLRETSEPVTPADLLTGFDGARVSTDDPVVEWTGSQLQVGEFGPGGSRT